MNRRNLRRTRPTQLLAVASVAMVIGACGGGDDSGLSEAAENGKRIATGSGCASCHGSDGRGGVGPPWRGIADTEVELDDGRVVVRDDDYLLRSILDPEADVVPGFAVNMPVNNLSESEARDVIAYIRELGADD